MLILALLIATAPLPFKKPAKAEAPLPPFPVPGQYLVRWGMNTGEGHLKNDGTHWYMCGTSRYHGEYRYDVATNKLYWFEQSTAAQHYYRAEYVFQMDKTGLKGQTDGGTIIHFQRWNGKQK